jgi:hypothetical protein
MKSVVRIIVLFLAFASGLACAEQILQYEPSVGEVSGSVRSGKFRHPNGKWVNFYSLALNTPADIKADGINAINISEKTVKEI